MSSCCSYGYNLLLEGKDAASLLEREGKSQVWSPLGILTFTTNICPKPRNPESSRRSICPHLTHPAGTHKHALFKSGLHSLCSSALCPNIVSQLSCPAEQGRGSKLGANGLGRMSQHGILWPCLIHLLGRRGMAAGPQARLGVQREALMSPPYWGMGRNRRKLK